MTWYRKCAKLKTESKLSIRQKRMGRMKGGIALEKPPGGAAQGQGDQAGGAGGGAGGVPPDIGSLENGRYNPSILLAFKLARYFGTTIEDIFIYEEDGT